MDEESKALLRLSLTRGIGTTTYRVLLERFGSASAILSADRKDLQDTRGIGAKLADEFARSRDSTDVDRELALAQEHGVNIIPFTHEHYPRNLKTIYDPPLVLYVKGDIDPNDVLSMAIVGSRRCTHYGQSQSRRLARLLGQSGFTIISGLARGTDTAAHLGDGYGRTPGGAGGRRQNHRCNGLRSGKGVSQGKQRALRAYKLPGRGCLRAADAHPSHPEELSPEKPPDKRVFTGCGSGGSEPAERRADNRTLGARTG